MYFGRQRKNLEWKRNSRETKEESRHDAGLRIPPTDIRVGLKHWSCTCTRVNLLVHTGVVCII